MICYCEKVVAEEGGSSEMHWRGNVYSEAATRQRPVKTNKVIIPNMLCGDLQS
jgi:hypothetical protein